MGESPILFININNKCLQNILQTFINIKIKQLKIKCRANLQLPNLHRYLVNCLWPFN